MERTHVTYANDRAGHGRWAAMYWPATGTLWTDNNERLGFLPLPKVDPTAVQTLIDNAHAAGKPASQAFDELTVGLVIKTGQLDNWREDRKAISTRLGAYLTAGGASETTS